MITLLLAATLTAQVNQLSGVVTDGKKPLEDVVVWVEGDFIVKVGKATVSQKNKRFVPRITVVTKGSTVSFPNNDTVYHNVFAEYNAKTFDLGMYPKGQSKSVTFDDVGIVSVLCNMHSNMSAYVIVVDSPHFTKTDKRGKYTLNVPNGSYRVRAWHESGKSSSQLLRLSGTATVHNIKVARK